MAKSKILQLSNNDRKVIQELEAYLGIVLPVLEPGYSSPGFRLNNQGQVTEICLTQISIIRLDRIVSILKKLPTFNSLDLSDTNIKDLSPLTDLTELQTLDISGNSITDINPLLKLSKLKNLYAYSNTIRDLSPLTALIGLKALNLSENPVVNLDPLKKLYSLTFLSLTATGITDIRALEGLKNIKRLYLSETGITDITPLSLLVDLINLDLGKTNIENITPLAQLVALQSLDLEETNISNLAPLVHLSSLKILKLNGSVINNLPALAHLSYLHTIELNHAKIIDFSPLNNLKQLKRLEVSGTITGDITPLAGCLGLEFLNASDTSLSYIEPLANLLELKTLDLSYNSIKDIYPLHKLSHLISIELHSNEIEDISALENLMQLRRVTLWDNPISELPVWITNYNVDIIWAKHPEKFETPFKELGIFLANNPLISPPPEIITRGKEAIKTWFTEEKIFLDEVKVLLVGQGEVGKTSLVKSIKGEKPNPREPATHNINISSHQIPHKKKNIQLNFWDFGGQDVMHSTHQFFLSKRCIYILVLDGRKDEDPEYWLKHIESFGGNSPVLVVMNKIDTNPGYDVDRRFLQNKYPFIAGFYKTACGKKSRGIDELTSGLKESLDKVELLTTPWPKSWFAVKNSIESMQDDFISQNRFVQLCVENRIFKEKAQQALTDYLNDLGVVVHFNDMQLTDLHILQPRWASQAAYKIITSELVAGHSGFLKVEWLTEIMKKKNKTDYLYRSEHHRYILELMQKFELCYSLDHGKSYLIPELLNIQQPEIPEQAGPLLKFYFQYEDLLPRSIISRFIVRMHEDIQDDLRWRTGVVLKSNLYDANVIVIADIKERRINISVCGTQRSKFFAIIRNTFHSLHKTFEKMNVTEYVPLPGIDGHSVGYNNLLGHEKNNKDEYFDGTLQKSFKVKELLDGIEPENIRKGEFKWDCFLCHSSKDKAIIEKIAADLKARSITYWFDEEQIYLGDNIIDKITEGLQNCKYIIACISENQLNSGWARNEYQSILTKVIAGNTLQKVVPFILDNTPNDKIPLFLNHIHYERYSPPEQYNKFLEFLDRKKQYRN